MSNITPETCPKRAHHGDPFRYCPVKGCGWMEPSPPKTGAELIADERRRQIDVEGYTAEQDDSTARFQQMNQAARTYLAAAYLAHNGHDPRRAADKVGLCWPWNIEFFKPSTDPIPNLVKAGALIAAEIDRIQRKADAS